MHGFVPKVTSSILRSLIKSGQVHVAYTVGVPKFVTLFKDGLSVKNNYLASSTDPLYEPHHEKTGFMNIQK